MKNENLDFGLNNLSGEISSGTHTPFWFEGLINPIEFPPLKMDIETDVLVIGGGIAGLTTAYLLATNGRKVVLVEDGCIGSGETGRTTGHLTAVLDYRYNEIEKVHDESTAKLVAESHTVAINLISNIIKSNNINCHFKQVNGYLFAHDSDSTTSLQEEYKATQSAGLITQMLNKIPGMPSEQVKWCIQYSGQAQLHIMLYINGLVEAIIKSGGKIYTHSRAESISKNGATVNGFNINANHIVVATNSPVNDWVKIHTKQWPYRTYVIGVKVPKGKLPYALWWDTGDKDSKWISKPYHYVRVEEFDEVHDLLIAGGEDHRTGQADTEEITEADRYNKLISWTKKHFPFIEDIKYKWSGQVLEPIDGLAYMGKNPGDDNIYIITGHSGNGITYSTIGAKIIFDSISEVENPWVKIYNPSRFNMDSTADYLHEAGNMIAQYSDWLKFSNKQKDLDLKPGDGAVLVSGTSHSTVFKDNANTIHKCKAICPHLGGILQWNDDEKSFDCPIHGSRFTGNGTVINGPAVADLKKIKK